VQTQLEEESWLMAGEEEEGQKGSLAETSISEDMLKDARSVKMAYCEMKRNLKEKIEI